MLKRVPSVGGLASVWFINSLLGVIGSLNLAPVAIAQSPQLNTTPLPRNPDQTIECEILVAGGGLAGTATAYEALLAGRTVCLTEITDWIGGQLTSQGTSALDETKKQRQLLFYARGYLEFRRRIEQKYGTLNPGQCWVSVSCFIPKDAQQILTDMLQEAARKGKGTLKWFPFTVIKNLELSANGKLIERAIAIQHRPAPGTPALNGEPLSQTIEDAYRYENSPRLVKKIIQFVPLQRQKAEGKGQRAEGGKGKEDEGDRGDREDRGETPFPTPYSPLPTPWIVIDATETGELIALADVPYRVGLDPRNYRNPSSPTPNGYPYCLQGYTYTFAMERTAEPQPQQMPSTYAEYEPYYGYDVDPQKANFEYVFTYRRIWNPKTDQREKAGPLTLAASSPGSISMQNWVWGNDYRPGTERDNLVYDRFQLLQTGQLRPGGWMGGLRTESLRKAEAAGLGFYYWLVAGTTDSQLHPSLKQPEPNHRLLTGINSPMGTEHGLSKYPYIREGRRLLGRPAYGYPHGFTIAEADFSGEDFRAEYYRKLPESTYRDLWVSLAGLETAKVIREDIPPDQIQRRTRSRIYPDAVGISQYPIDFHPCMLESPPEKPGNIEFPGVRQAHGLSYPAQIPLRAMIPQQVDNLLVAGKSIATSYSAAAAYRVHPFEWSAGAAAGTTASFVLSKGLLPYQLVDDLPRPEPELEALQRLLDANGNPIAFPHTSIFNLDWDEWVSW
ncbi:FAD-dependent oxidoreductase [Kovacikia minuta CCNUW1]|uniref:FAD-dependent oxidoreductase n=1 Tax=Kovacikia minuta TaxID=2931930 RepID=UPI001CCF9E48|nr:FAD-dependent oxidoreductase [Kovacikia minuta]UBF28059.1 FAD-dependent oxidoreductase [Kovacikia minuta CCNUW1]